jgi:hypothetical protein
MELQKVTLKKIETALRRVPSPRLPEVLTFIEFLEYRAKRDEGYDFDDPSEDAALWAAVEADDAYKAQHPGEMIIHESGEAFLAATADR